jgi:hypothetical protein
VGRFSCRDCGGFKHPSEHSGVRTASQQFARKPSDGNWFASREVSGSLKVTESLHPSQMRQQK